MMTQKAERTTQDSDATDIEATETVDAGAQTSSSTQQSEQIGRDLFARLAQASISDAISLFIRSERRRHASLADLEWLLAPALKYKQIKFTYARPKPSASGKAALEAVDAAAVNPELPPLAVAMVTWALVSRDVALKLDAQRKAGLPYQLAPHEWQCGDLPRVIDAIGDEAAVKALVEQVKRVHSNKK